MKKKGEAKQNEEWDRGHSEQDERNDRKGARQTKDTQKEKRNTHSTSTKLPESDTNQRVDNTEKKEEKISHFEKTKHSPFHSLLLFSLGATGTPWQNAC